MPTVLLVLFTDTIPLVLRTGEWVLPTVSLGFPTVELVFTTAQLFLSTAQLFLSTAQLLVPIAQLGFPAEQFDFPPQQGLLQENAIVEMIRIKVHCFDDDGRRKRESRSSRRPPVAKDFTIYRNYLKKRFSTKDD